MRKIYLPIAVAALLSSQQVMASDLSVGVDVGLIGAGINLGFDYDDRFAARYSSTSLEVDDIDIEETSANYTGELDWCFDRITGIWYPFRGAFYLTAGIAKNKSSITASLEEGSGSVFVGGNTYSLSDVGDVKVEADFPSSSTYFGLGWRGGHENKGFVTRLEIGLASGKTPDVTVTAANAGTISQVDLDAEIQEIEDGMEDANQFPFIMLGIEYHFDVQKLKNLGSS